MPGAVGAGQAAGHLGAKDRLHSDAQVFGQGGHVEAGEMENLLDRLALHQGLEPRRFLLAPGQADAANIVLVVANLNQAEPIAAMDQAHRLGVDRQGPGTGIEGLPLGIQIAIKDAKASWGGQVAGGGSAHGRGSRAGDGMGPC